MGGGRLYAARRHSTVVYDFRLCAMWADTVLLREACFVEIVRSGVRGWMVCGVEGDREMDRDIHLIVIGLLPVTCL